MVNLERLIGEHLERVVDTDPRGKFRVSDVGKCLLMRILKRHGVKRVSNPPEKLRRRFWIGHLFHDFIQNYIIGQLHTEFDIKAEEVVEDEHRKGHYDLLVGDTLYELKTIKDLKWVKNSIKSHGMQVYTYQELLGKENIQNVQLLYVDITSFDIKQITPMEAYRSSAERDWERAIQTWEKGEIPPPEKDWYCSACPYQAICPAFTGSWEAVDRAIEEAKENEEA